MGFNWGTVLQGIGALAGAWGSYETSKEATKIEKEKLSYEKNKDAIAEAKTQIAQDNLDSALSSVYTTTNKKKKKTSTLDDAFASTNIA